MNLIFDWSGTLSDDFNSVYDSVMTVMDSLVGKRISKEEFKEKFTLPYMNFFWDNYNKNIKKEDCDKIFTKSINEASKPKPYTGVVKTLKILHLKPFKCKMIIVSSHKTPNLLQEAEEYGVKQYFQEINGDVYDKTLAIEKIIIRNKFKVSETCFIGDMTHDIDAGRAAKVKTIAVDWGYQSRDVLKKHNPDYIVSSFNELIDLLKKINF